MRFKYLEAEADKEVPYVMYVSSECVTSVKPVMDH